MGRYNSGDQPRSVNWSTRGCAVDLLVYFLNIIRTVEFDYSAAAPLKILAKDLCLPAYTIPLKKSDFKLWKVLLFFQPTAVHAHRAALALSTAASTPV
jgi:hypothetical protein